MSRRFLKRCAKWFGLSAVLFAVGCGGGSGKAQLRVLLAAPNESSVDTLVDSVVVNTNLGYTANTGYFSVNSGTRHVQIETSGSSNFIVDQKDSLAANDSYTLIAAGLSPSVTGIFLTDNTTAPASGTAMVRLVNAAPSMGSADVYVVAAGSSLSGAPTVASLAPETVSSYQNITIPTTATNFQIYFTQPGTTFVLLTVGPINLSSGQNRTIVAMNNQSGGFTSATLADLN